MVKPNGAGMVWLGPMGHAEMGKACPMGLCFDGFN